MAILQAIQGYANSAASSIRGALGGMTELDRQQLTGDDQFCQPYVAFFELQDGTSASYLFPLVYAPQQVQIAEPFAVDIVPTLDSSLYVEEGGCVQRRITMAGSTGFAPHPLPLPRPVLPGQSTLPTNYAPADLAPTIVAALSGPRQFEYLKNTVFRAYSDLKRDPQTAKNAKMCLHLPTAGEHFQVVPMSFVGSRSAQSPFTTPYQIELLVVGPAEPATLPIAVTDQGWLGNFRDAVAATNQALGNLRGAINDLTAVQGSFRILGGQVAAIISNASSIAVAAQNFLAGTSSLIDVPLAGVSALFNLVVQTLGVYTSTLALGNQLADWPQAIVERFRSMMNACDTLLAHPEVFEAPVSQRLVALNAYGLQLSQAQNVATVASFADIQRAGSANLPGDADIASVAASNPPLPTFRSIRTVTARQGDTLVGIAAREMGDGNLWRALAIVNDLTPPVTGAQGRLYANLSDAANDLALLAPGEQVLVPSTQATPDALQSPAVLGVPPTAPAETQLLGSDLALQPVGSASAPLFDLQTTAVAGGQDFATVTGTDALAQAVGSQVTQIKGTNVLYPDVGLEPIVGTGLAQADYALLQYRVESALTRDPRVQGIASLAITVSGTAVQVVAELTAAGLQGTVPVQIAA